MNMPHCCQPTKKGKRCPINADRERDGRAYCHVHDPQGVYQRQNRGELPRHDPEPEAQRERDRSQLVEDRDWAMKRARIDDFQEWVLPPDGCPFEPGIFHLKGLP